MPNSALNPGQAVVEYELIVPNSPSIVLNKGTVNHDHSSLVDTIYGICVYSHRIHTLNTDFVDKQIKKAMAAGTPRLRFRLGVGDPSNMFWLPWQEHIITAFSAMLESVSDQAGHVIEIETQDLQFALSRGGKTAAHKGTISKIVTGIAESYGFSKSVIESTAGEGAYVQSFMDDLQFVRTRMIKRSRNDKGRGNFLFYFKDNTLHFHSPDYQADIHNIVYYQANSAALTQVDHSQKLLDLGVAGTQVIGYDPYTGNVLVSQSDPSKALRLADSIYDYSKLGAALQMPYHLSTNFAQEAEVIGQNTYEHTRSTTFDLMLEVDKTIQIRHGDFVNMVIAPSDSKASPWSGFYLVAEARHIVQKGSVRSFYRLKRGEIRKSLVNLTSVRSEDILVIEQNAPGQDLNVSEVKNSQRTKGAGSLASDGRLFLTVQQPG